MAKKNRSGDWGSDASLIPKAVKGETNENFYGTTPKAMTPQGEAPLLKQYSESNYHRPPFNPEFEREEARGEKGYKHGQ